MADTPKKTLGLETAEPAVTPPPANVENATEEENEIVKSTTSAKEETPQVIISRDQILSYQDLVRRVPVADNVVEFAVNLVSQTRPTDGCPDFINDWVEWGAGPRASLIVPVTEPMTRAIFIRKIPGTAQSQQVSPGWR